MQSGVDKISKKLIARRQLLLERYDEEDLHKLRVTIRRARALLKQMSGHQARDLRKQWGGIADHTNAARDWDTLALYSNGALDSRQWESVAPLLQARCDRAHAEVAAALESDQWERTMRQWETLAAREKKADLSDQHLSHALDATARKVLEAGAKALTEGTDRDWHKCRIAVKDLRYTIDSLDLEGPAAHAQLTELKQLCKRLQDELGDWHDTVVHRALLSSLAEETPAAESPAADAAISALQERITRRGNECLQRVMAILQEEGPLLAEAAGIDLPDPAGRDNVEIERKFHVRLDRLGPLQGGEEIHQGFIPTANETAVRVRLSGARAWLTLKGRTEGAARSEFEYAIPVEEARRILTELCQGGVVHKTRYCLEHRGHHWEVDVFHGVNDGLVIAEVELRDEAEQLELPEWVDLEVTGDPRYYNANLANHPFSEWNSAD